MAARTIRIYFRKCFVEICYEIFTKCRSGGGICIFEIAWMYFFTEVLKTHFYYFKNFLSLTKVTNENTEVIDRVLYKF